MGIKAHGRADDELAVATVVRDTRQPHLSAAV
jgi:hypothetical protein